MGNADGSMLPSLVLPILFIFLATNLSQATHHFVFGWFDSIANFFGNFWSGILNFFHVQTPPPQTPQQQFEGALSELENNTQNIATTGMAEARNYGYGNYTSESIAVYVTDVNSTTNNTVIGQFTAIWNGTAQSLTITDGIVNTSITPLYNVTITHAAFIPLAQAVAKTDAITIVADFGSDKTSGSLSYHRIR